MAATQINVGTEVITRGKTRTGLSFTAATQAFQFGVSQGHVPPNGLDCLTASVVGGTGTTGLALEASIDAGTSWFSVAGRTTGSAFGTTTIGSDPAVVAAVSYDITGLAGALLRIGVTGITAGTAVVSLLVS